jgi:hypothetical protein
MYKVRISIYSNICSLPKIGKPNQTPLRYQGAGEVKGSRCAVTAPRSTTTASRPDQRRPDVAASVPLRAQEGIAAVFSCFLSSVYCACHLFDEMTCRSLD